jgi:D-alanyl-D-alanine carboxypeptidase/D-alanyl-D-alanine-endopeptidase (penicillin-binding protein 4)
MYIRHIYQIFFLAILFSSCVGTQKIKRDFIEQITQDTLLKNAHVGIAIWNTEENRFLSQHNSHKYFVPASNVKIATLYAAMKYLPDSLASFDYYDTPDTLFIIPKGNPAFFHPDFKDLPDFAFLKKSGKPIVILPVLWETEIYGKGWAWDDHQSLYMPKRSPMPIGGNRIQNKDSTQNCFPTVLQMYQNAASRLSDTLGLPVIVSATERSFNEKLNTYSSVHKDSICKKMMFESDNFIAEQLLLMTSDKLLGCMNEKKLIEKLISDTIISFPQNPVWVDGSGLSRYNLFTPEDMIIILQKLENEFGRNRIEAIFPTGNQGTLKGYYDDKAGYIFAKTGTLSGQISLSGYLTTRKKTPLIFSLMINNHSGKASQVKNIIAEYMEGVLRTL